MEIFRVRELPYPPDEWPKKGIYGLLRLLRLLVAGLGGGDEVSGSGMAPRRLRRGLLSHEEEENSVAFSLLTRPTRDFNWAFWCKMTKMPSYLIPLSRLYIGAKMSFGI